MKIKQITKAVTGISILSLLTVLPVHADTITGGPNGCIVVSDTLNFDSASNFTFIATLNNTCDQSIELSKLRPLYVRSISGNPSPIPLTPPTYIKNIAVTPPSYALECGGPGPYWYPCSDQYGQYIGVYNNNGSMLAGHSSVSIYVTGNAAGYPSGFYQWASGVNTGTYYVVAYSTAYKPN